MMIILLAAIVGVLAFLMGRKYERKQFVQIGTKRPTTQDIILGGKK
jgi:hypothetical protein